MLEKELKGREHTKGVDHPETLHVVSSSLLLSNLHPYSLLSFLFRELTYSPQRYALLQKFSFPFSTLTNLAISLH